MATKPKDTVTPSVLSTFTDSTGKSWRVRVSIGSAMKVKKELGLDLLSVLQNEDELKRLLFADPLARATVLWLTIMHDAKAENVTEEEFFGRLDPTSLEKGTEALLLAAAEYAPRGAIARQVLADLPKMLAAMDDAAAGAVEKSFADSFAKAGIGAVS